jgi:NAD(P)-dependent dehydrogenase (short-subunit alcohol dehydrogenase family)
MPSKEILRLDGQIAVVTGAGGSPSLGRCYARLLAARGASVVVNDIGAAASGGRGCSANADAAAVAAEIVADGGTAVADTNSVASADGAAAIVATALENFGRLDILVNNAGVCLWAGLDEMSVADIERHVAVNLFGSIWMCRAAWPTMREQHYGRIVNITSGSAYGMMPGTSVYGAAKGGVLAFTKAVAAEMEPHGVRCNAISPVARTGMVASAAHPDSPMFGASPPDLVAPGVLLLSHRDCPVNGEVLRSVDGVFGRVTISQSTSISTGVRDDAAETLLAQSHDLFGPDGLTPVEIAPLSLLEQLRLKPYMPE